jgi:hypothetical protein
VVIECDPAGGDLMRRHRLNARPGLVDLAAATRAAGPAAAPLTSCAQHVHIGRTSVAVVVAPAGGAQTRAALPELTSAGREVLANPDRLVIADCGRMDAGTAVWPLLGLADVVIVLSRARVDELAHTRDALGPLLDTVTGHVVIQLAPGGQYATADVAEVLGQYVAEELARDSAALTVLDPMPDDRRAAAVLGGELLAWRRWRRLPLIRAAGQLLTRIEPPLPAAPRRDEHARTESS